jgi:hypothetical protein
MKSRRTKRPEPRTELIGLNLTDADLAQLDTLFAALNATSSGKRKVRPLTRSTVAYQCFQAGLEHQLQDKPSPRPSNPVPYNPSNRPKRNAKLVGIYISRTDCAQLIKLDSILERRLWGRSWLRGEERHPFEFRKPTSLAYLCFQRGLSLLRKQLPSNRNTGAGPHTNAA